MRSRHRSPSRPADYPTAIEFAQRASVLNPEFWVAYYQLAQAQERWGHDDAALEALQQAVLVGTGNSKGIALRGYLFAKQGRTREAREVLTMLEAVSREQYVPPYASALVHAGLGETELTLRWLARAYDVHDVHLALLVMDPKWDPFRADARFLALIDRCGFTAGATGQQNIAG